MEGENSSLPISFSDLIFSWLDSALDYGIKEWEFWDMTIPELERAIESKKRLLQLEAKEQAANNYLLADLIGRSIARMHTDAEVFPEIYDFYPTLFDKEAILKSRAEERAKQSALRFTQFATSHNKKLTEEVAKEVE